MENDPKRGGILAAMAAGLAVAYSLRLYRMFRIGFWHGPQHFAEASELTNPANAKKSPGKEVASTPATDKGKKWPPVVE